MGNNNKRKIITGCVAGAILLLFAAVLAACSKDNNVEVASIVEDVNVDDAMSDISSDTEETSNEEEPNIEEPDIEESNIETTEPTTTSPTTTSSSWGTPQEYNGDPEGRGPDRIIVKGFNYNDFLDGVSWKGEYWTASNGVEIKVVSIIDGKGVGMIAVPDGKGKDIEFNSPYMVAVAEAEGINLNKYVADLNVTIPLATYKRTEIAILEDLMLSLIMMNGMHIKTAR